MTSYKIRVVLVWLKRSLTVGCVFICLYALTMGFCEILFRDMSAQPMRMFLSILGLISFIIGCGACIRFSCAIVDVIILSPIKPPPVDVSKPLCSECPDFEKLGLTACEGCSGRK